MDKIYRSTIKLCSCMQFIGDPLPGILKFYYSSPPPQQEFALKACIEKFNALYYQPDSSPPVPTLSSANTAGVLMAGMGGGVTGEEGVASDLGGTSEEEQFVPLDLNYLSSLRKEVGLLFQHSFGRKIEVELL